MRNKKLLAVIFAVLLQWVSNPVFVSAASSDSFSPVDYVNPLIGSQSTYELSTGNTYPAIALPWGMNFWVPQTGRWEMDGLTRIQPTRFGVLSKPTSPVRG